MRHAQVSRVGKVTLFGIMVLSVGLVLMADRAGAAAPSKGGSSSTTTQNWDTVLPVAERFTVLTDFSSAAVRDNETGLVWERSPVPGDTTWSDARGTCLNKNIGGRKGWRQSSIVELMSLWDPSLLLPTSVFIGVQSAFYWTVTSDAANPSYGWRVNFGFGVANSGPKTDNGFAWCVRGPMNADQY